VEPGDCPFGQGQTGLLSGLEPEGGYSPGLITKATRGWEQPSATSKPKALANMKMRINRAVHDRTLSFTRQACRLDVPFSAALVSSSKEATSKACLEMLKPNRHRPASRNNPGRSRLSTIMRI